MNDIASLHRRLLAVGPPHRPGRRELAEELGQAFGATEVPLALLSGEFHAGPEGIVEGRDVLLSITDARRLDASAVDDERENVDRDNLEDRLASADAETDPADRLYSRTLVEHGAGLRTSVLLRGDAADPDELAGYAVHGVLGAARLDEFLAVRLGVPDMRVGDLTDESFIYYLQLLAIDGRI